MVATPFDLSSHSTMSKKIGNVALRNSKNKTIKNKIQLHVLKWNQEANNDKINFIYNSSKILCRATIGQNRSCDTNPQVIFPISVVPLFRVVNRLHVPIFKNLQNDFHVWHRDLPYWRISFHLASQICTDICSRTLSVFLEACNLFLASLSFTDDVQKTKEVHTFISFPLAVNKMLKQNILATKFRFYKERRLSHLSQGQESFPGKDKPW